MTPLHLSTTFETGASGEPDYKYTRFGNPTRTAVESKLARLEGADHGLALSSGMAAVSTVCFGLLSPGDHVVAFESLFGALDVSNRPTRFGRVCQKAL